MNKKKELSPSHQFDIKRNELNDWIENDILQ